MRPVHPVPLHNGNTVWTPRSRKSLTCGAGKQKSSQLRKLLDTPVSVADLVRHSK